MTKDVAKIFERKTAITVLLPQSTVITPSWVYPENIPFRLILLRIDHCSVIGQNPLYPSGFIQGVPSFMARTAAQGKSGHSRAVKSERAGFPGSGPGSHV